MRDTAVLAAVGLALAPAPLLAAAAAAVPGPDALGDYRAWRPEHAKALDPVYDTEIPGTDAGDLMSLYYDQSPERLAFRVGLRDLDRDDFLSDGRVGIDIHLDWGAGAAAIEIGRDGALLREIGRTPSSARVRRTAVTPAAQMVEVSIAPPSGFPRVAAAVDIVVTSVIGGRIQDRIETTSLSSVAAKNVVFVQHGNQGLTYTDVFRGNRGENAVSATDVNNPDDGFDELVAAHEAWSLPGCFHLAGQLQTAAEWHDPGFNTWLTGGVSSGWADMITSAYAQHMMPFAQDNMNNWAVNIEKQMTDWRYGSDAKVAWIPERVWLSNPDLDGNGTNAACGVVDATLWDNWLQHGVEAVILDDAWHLVQYDGVFDDRHVYIGGTGLKFVPIDNTFVGDVNWNWGNAWNTILGLSADELLVYGNDWEFCAEVSQGASNANALNNYLEILRQCALNSGTVAVWRLSDAINSPGFQQNMDGRPVENATYGLLGAHGGYGGSCNSWYTNWAGYANTQHIWDFHVPTWNYGTVWNNAYTKVIGSPANDLSESAWYVMMTNLHETGWHDNGEISGWIYRYSNHIKNANAYSEAARWAAGQYANTNDAYLADIDEDGQTEAVIHNDRVMAVFEPNGGRAAYVFAKGAGYGYSVVGNCNVYWVDTEGDYNETNHVGALSDVSVAGIDREHDLYTFNVVQGAPSATVLLEIVHPNVTRTVSLTQGDKYLDVVWDASGQDVYVKSGLSPDLVDLIWNADLDRIWAPAPSGAWFGQRNPNTGATAAIIVGDGGATHNAQYTSTLMEVDEFYGRGKFEAWLFAGETAAPGGGGAIAELDSLAALLFDALPPAPTTALYYPSADKLSINFDELVQYDQVVVTGISVDDDNDGVAELTLTGASTVLTTQDASRLDIQLAPASATVLEGLNTAALELMMAAGAVRDPANNLSAAVDNTADVPVEYQPATLVTIDGFIDAAEWTPSTCIVSDFWDSGWTTPAPADTNEVNALYMTWDDTYLYLGIRGLVYGNSWILYLDTDPGGPNGEADLSGIDAWERGAMFTGGFRADFEYGCYQHQSPFDSDSFFKILTDSTTQNFSGSIIKAFDSSHLYYLNGGSELAIPWDVLYGLGAGNVAPNAEICLVASICWDPEPNGQLGGDVAPHNVAAVLPSIDGWISFPVDGDGDGLPDDPAVGVNAPQVAAGPAIDRLAISGVVPNPFGAAARIDFTLPAEAAGTTRLAVFDVSGRRVTLVLDRRMEPGRHSVVWDGRDDTGQTLASGVYFARLASSAGEAVRKIVLLR
jgi:hypothetical protein